MSTAEKIFRKAQALPEPTQTALLQIVESLAAKTGSQELGPKPQFGSANGLITISPNFDEPLEDFKAYRE
jgi:hypothetical protein